MGLTGRGFLNSWWGKRRKACILFVTKLTKGGSLESKIIIENSSTMYLVQDASTFNFSERMLTILAKLWNACSKEIV